MSTMWNRTLSSAKAACERAQDQRTAGARLCAQAAVDNLAMCAHTPDEHGVVRTLRESLRYGPSRVKA